MIKMKLKIPTVVKYVFVIYIGLLICGSIGTIGKWILFIAVVTVMGYACLRLLYAMLSGILDSISALTLSSIKIRNDQKEEFKTREYWDRQKEKSETESVINQIKYD